MTIIAWDGKTVSADRMVTMLERDLRYTTEKIRPLMAPLRGTEKENAPVFTAIAGSGKMIPFFAFVDQLQDAARRGETFKEFRANMAKYSPIHFHDWGFTALLIGTNHEGNPTFAAVNKSLYDVKVPFVSYGSGSTFLKENDGAFKDSIEMVVAASTMDAHCGFKIDTYDPVTQQLTTIDRYPTTKRWVLHQRLMENYSKKIAGILVDTHDGLLHFKKD